MIHQKTRNTTDSVAGLGRKAGLLLVPVIIVMYLAWPGNHMWGDPDQAITVKLALQANRAGELSSYWRLGNAGFAYHPFPVWIYQLFLSLTHNLIWIRLAKAFIGLAVCLTGLHYLFRRLSYFRWGIILFCFSPFCYIYNFELTDDAWLVPVSFLVFLTYSRFCRTRTAMAFFGVLFFSVLSAYLHPRGAILLPAVMAALVLFDRKWLREHVSSLFMLLFAVGLVVFPYLYQGRIWTTGSFQPVSISAVGRLAQFLSALTTGTVFFSYDLFQLVIPFDHLPSVVAVAARFLMGITMMAYLLVFCGAFISLAGLIKARKTDSALTLEDRLGGLSLISVLMLGLTIVYFNLFNTVEYYTVVWFSYFFFVWRAIQAFESKRFWRLLTSAYLFSMAVSWICLWAVIHFGGMGLTLSDAMTAAQELSRYSPQSRVIQSVDLKYGSPVDIMNRNRQKAFGNGWYYDKCLNFINNSDTLKDSLNGRYLYMTLVPLLDIYYADRDVTQLPVRIITLEFQNGTSGERLSVRPRPEGQQP